MGHQAGKKALKACIETCVALAIPTLTVFAFSSENWNRPAGEVSRLMDLFLKALDKEALELHEHGVRLRFIGDKTAFKAKLQTKMADAEALTMGNQRMTVNVAVNYGGRWDITQAATRMAADMAARGQPPTDISEAQFSSYLALADSPDPDLFIRTGGEMRISNFLLWQAAYTEFFFTPVLWPDFDEGTLRQAIASFQGRERRFGQTSEQLSDRASA